MGKGKGSFDHWASRIAVSKVIFEIKGDIHEQVARDAFRLAGNKMPGTCMREKRAWSEQDMGREFGAASRAQQEADGAVACPPACSAPRKHIIRAPANYHPRHVRVRKEG